MTNVNFDLSISDRATNLKVILGLRTKLLGEIRLGLDLTWRTECDVNFVHLNTRSELFFSS